MTFNPCGCGNPLQNAKEYRMRENPNVKIKAVQMLREFAVPFMGKVAKGIEGDYLCSDSAERRYVVQKDIFEENYELIV